MLSYAYKIAKQDLYDLLSDFIFGVDNLVIQQDEIAKGLQMLKIGGDFADMINAYAGNLAGGQVFVSFDKKACQKLERLGLNTWLLESE